MARLNDLINAPSAVEDGDTELIEMLETLIEMVSDNELAIEDIDALTEVIDFIIADENEYQLDEVMLNKMSPEEKKEAAMYRRKNKARLAKAASKRKMKLKAFAPRRKKCLVKIAGKEGWDCNSQGKPYKKKTRK